MENRKVSQVRRISIDLDNEIKRLMQNNNISDYTQASREMAKVASKLKGRRIFREIKF